MSQVKRICAGLLAIMMLMSFLTVSAFAATPAGMEVTTDGESIDKLKAGDTVTVKLTLPVMEKLAGVQIELGFDKSSFEFQEKTQYDEDLGTDVKVINTGLNKWNPTITDKGNANTTGTVAFNAVGTTNRKITTEGFNLLTIEFKVLDGANSSAQFSVNLFNLGYIDSEHSAQPITDVTAPSSKTVTILKAPITSVSFTLTDPAQGAALPSLSGLGSAYTGAVEWYEGASATGTAVTSNAKPNTKYTAKITLTVGTGESFADSVTIPTGYTKDSSSTSNKLVLTKTFPETGSLPAATVTAPPTAYPSLEYKGSEQFLLNFGGNANGGTMQYRLDNSAWSTDIPKGTDAKTYTVYYMVKGDSDHSDSTVANVQVTIDPKDISSATIGTIADQPYTGSAITPDPTVTDSTATLEKGKDYTVSCDDIYVGNATLTINGTGNYNGTKSANFNIVAADQNPTFTTPVDLVSGGHRLDLTTLVSGAKSDVMTFTITSGTAATLSGHELESTGTTGPVTIKVSIAAKDMNGDTVNEYNAFSKSEAITVNVVDKTPASVTTAPEAVENLKYNGSEQELVTKGAASGGEMQYSLGSSPWSTEIPTAKDAGTYTVEYKVVGDSYHTDYTPTSNTVSVTIGPKVLHSSDLEQSGGSATKAYDGDVNNSSITVHVREGVLYGSDTLPITGTAVYNSADVADANQITFTPTAITTGNYTLAASEKLTITPASITPRDLIVTPNAGQSKKFGAEDPTLHSTNSGRVTGQIPDFSGALSRVEGKDVGQYDITLGSLALIDHFSSGFKASNYELKMVSPAVKFEITKADALALENITLSQKYNVTTEQSKDIGRAGMPEDAGALTYRADSSSVITTGTATVSSFTVDSTGMVKYTITGGTKDEIITLPVTIESTNYADATVHVVITLTKPSYSGGTSYAITVEKAENGTVSADRGSASKGSTVTITVKPDKGYELDALKVLDKNGDKVKLTEKNGKYTFTMPAGKVTVKGSFVEEVLFDDVKVGDYFYEAVKWAVKKDITNGVGNDLFAPNQPCTRGQIVTFLWRAAGSPEAKAMSAFSDVADSAYYAKAVAWAVENGITGGTGNGKFSPDATCTRAQAVTFLYRAAGSPKVSGSAEFGDVATNAYYADAVAWAAKNGITGGIGGGLFGSDNDCTRAQIVTFLYRSVK